MKTGFLISLLIFLLLSPCVADACSCAGFASVCEAYTNADAVFIGTVGRTERPQPKMNADGEVYSAGQTAYVQVEKPFKGVRETEVVFRSGGSSCDRILKEGERLLFYASYDKKSKTFRIGACSRTTSINKASDAADDLMYLQALPAAAEKTRISGTLLSHGYNPLIGIKVTLSGPQKSYEVYTDKNGVYEIYGLPPGRYNVKTERPPGLTVGFASYSLSPTDENTQSNGILLLEKGCAGVNFYFNSDTSISGRVVGPDGRPLPKVCLNIMPKDETDPNSPGFECTDEQGRYEFDATPPGEYIIVANDEGTISSEKPFPATYYPGVFEKQKATVLVITEGVHIENQDLHIPSQEATRVIQGLLVYADGRPVVNKAVSFKPEAAKEGYDGEARTLTDAQGRFSLTVLQGLNGWLRGSMYVYQSEYLNCPLLDKLIKAQGEGPAEVETQPLRLETNTDFQDIKLVFPFPSCVKAKPAQQ
jgi:protocatechuate 3,4-dioxygenase beta subunit